MDWNRDEYLDMMHDLHSIMDQAIQRGDRIRLLICGNPELRGTKTPAHVCLWFVQDIVMMYGKLKKSIERTAIWKPSNDMDFFFDMLFAVYTPARPLKMFTDLGEASAWVLCADD